MGGHVVGAFVVVDPASGLRCEIGHPTGKVREHVGIGVLLNDEAGRGVLHKHRAKGRLKAAASDDLGHFSGDVAETAARRANFQDFLIGAQLAPDYAIILALVPAPAHPSRASLVPRRPSLRGLELTGLERKLDELTRRNRLAHGAFALCQLLVRRDIAAATSAMAFELFLASIPLLALSGWLFGRLLADHEAVLQAIALLVNLTPNEVQGLVWQHLDGFALGTAAPFALLGALWIASGAFHTSMALLEASSGTARRSWWRRRVIALLSVIVSIALFTLATGLAVWASGGPARLLAGLSGGDTVLDASVAHWLLLALLAMLGVALLALFFYVASPRPAVRRRVFPGATAAVLSGSVVSLAFAYYAGNLARFATFYGSLAAVAVTLAWLWLVCFSVLAGAELNQLLEDGE